MTWTDWHSFVRACSARHGHRRRGISCSPIDFFEKMLRAQAVDCQQADLTRGGGVTAFLRVASLCKSHHVDLSGHWVAIHLPHAACAAPRLRHLEWFHDHVRIEHMLLDGAPVPRDGTISPDLSRPGHGLVFKSRGTNVFASREVLHVVRTPNRI